MRLKRAVKQLFEKATKTRIYRTLPRGIDLFCDIEACLPHLNVSTVFDVGANVGQSAREFLKNFPESQIYCFEPVEQTYRQLQKELDGYTNVQTFKFALGAETGSRQMVLQGRSELAYLQPREMEEAHQGEMTVYDKTRLEQVILQTLDNLCENLNVRHIDFLKIDTEGGDMDVLRGTESLLNNQEVDMIQVEAGMNWQNRRHVAFEQLANFMEQRDYYLFGIYEQMHEWPTGAPNLRRTNPVYISERTVRDNTMF